MLVQLDVFHNLEDVGGVLESIGRGLRWGAWHPDNRGGDEDFRHVHGVEVVVGSAGAAGG